MNVLFRKAESVFLANKRAFTFILSVMIFIPLHKPIENAISKTSVDLLLSYVESTWYNDLLFFISVLGGVCFFIAKIKKYIPSLNLAYLLTVGCLIYLYYRLSG